jgi:NADH-quinone oxidoreductase subunit H
MSGDPLFREGVDATVLLIVAIKVVVAFAGLLVATMLMVWFERKVVADFQDRIGPARAGKWGILQTLADGIKLFFKEDLLPEAADRRVFRLAPVLASVPAFLSFAVVPVGGTVHLFGRETRLQVADPPVGILFLLAMSGVAVYGVMLAGWSSGSKYPLLGSVRASAQMISYEAAMGLSVVTVILSSGSLLTSDIVASQVGGRFGIANWNVLALGVVPFVIFFIASTAELNRPPFDMVEAEQELVGGFNTEYSSVRFALFFLAEFMNTVTMSGVVVTLFLGGPAGWKVGPIGEISPVWFFAKVVAFLFVHVWIRATLPRLRYDQLMDLGWKRLIPLSIGWLLLMAAVRLAQVEGWNRAVVVAAGIAAGAAVWAMLAYAMRIGAERATSEVGA